MACNFSIPFTGPVQGVLDRAKSAVQSQNGTFTGDESGGNFDVSVFGNTIAGTYTVTGQNMDIVIHNKPFLLPCNTIESYLKSQLGV